jgi:UDP-N-acetylglucosamine 1-carboxyvinyltransferase
MGKYSIIGGYSLNGELEIQGSKNAVLPVLAATILNKGTTYIHNCPKILDVYNMLKILENIGCVATWEKNTLIIDSSVITSNEITEKYVQMMRSSIILLGAALGRLKNVNISFPGGCSIGVRPIDLHLKAIKQMNVDVDEEYGYIICKTDQIEGANIHLDYPSVGATENVMLTAVLSKGITTIQNAAKEPEIIELQRFLNKMGAKVSGAGTDCIVVEGVSKLINNVEYRVMPDRIVAGTYMVATAVTNGDVLFKNINKSHIDSVISKVIEMGCKVDYYDNDIRVYAPERIKSIDLISTQPYPGFPTDMQAQIMSCLTIAKGTSVISETIFESRYKHVPELNKMGANIITEGRTAILKGVNRLRAAEVFAMDLRGGAALVIAGLNAEGKTIVNNAFHIQRGYEAIEKDLNLLGANVEYTET